MDDFLATGDEPGLLRAVDEAIAFIRTEPDRCWDVHAHIDAMNAVDIVTAARGRPSADFSPSHASWLQGRPMIASPERISAAIACLRKLQDSDYLAEVVHESDPDGWRAIYEDCLSRLR